MTMHRCTDAACPFEGQRTDRSCKCHKTDEQVLREQRDEFRDTLNKLEKAASEVSRLGAQRGPQWSRLAGSLISARALLSNPDLGATQP